MDNDTKILEFALHVFIIMLSITIVFFWLSVLAFKRKNTRYANFFIRLFKSRYMPADVVYLYIDKGEYEEAYRYLDGFTGGFYERDNPEQMLLTRIMLLANEGKWDEARALFMESSMMSDNLSLSLYGTVARMVEKKDLEKLNSIYFEEWGGEARLRPSDFRYILTLIAGPIAAGIALWSVAAAMRLWSTVQSAFL